MPPAEIAALARTLLDQHGLPDWQFRMDHARQRCGSCHYNRKEITLSKHFAQLNGGHEIRNTLLHEIAHALAGPGQAHGPVWRAAARRVGARVEATTDNAQMPAPPWALRCNHCGQVVARRFRRSLDLARHRCAHCGVRRGTLAWHRQGPPGA